jgi:hypothetical protein
MTLDRRSFLALMGTATATLLTGCGATATPTPGPTAPVYGPPAAPGPRFSVDRTDMDFGNVSFEKIVNAVFKVTNTGTTPLLLSVPAKVRAEAGC